MPFPGINWTKYDWPPYQLPSILARNATTIECITPYPLLLKPIGQRAMCLLAEARRMCQHGQHGVDEQASGFHFGDLGHLRLFRMGCR